MCAVHSQSPSGAMTVISAPVKGLSANKASILLELCKIQHCHCLCLQETHRAKDQAMPKIPGMPLIAERPHNKHGSSVFVRDCLKLNRISVCEEENVELITVELPGVVVHSLYKPPPEPCLIPPLGQRIKLHSVIGDFNSHSTPWGYTTTDSDGEAVEQWADQTDCHSSTTRNCRNHSTVQYGRRDTTRTSSLYLQTFRICVRSMFWIHSTGTQYRPICVTVHPGIVPQPTPFRRHFNWGKLNGTISQRILNETIE